MVQPAPAGTPSRPDLDGQTVLLIGEDSATGRAIEQRVRAAGARVVHPGLEGVDPAELDRVFDALPLPIDHVLVTGTDPYLAPLAEFDFTRAERDVQEHLWLPIRVARSAVGRVRPGGTLLFVGGSAAGRPGPGLTLTSALAAARHALITGLALEVAPIRVNLIGSGLDVDRPLSARLLGTTLAEHPSDPGATRQVARVVRPADVAPLAVHLMCVPVTGATYDVDGGGRRV
ncbi:SDR family oxidoreductase [Geodermatophilus aquaeductus]|uniref:NAD(P)-dependent dehydrogenase, short-chain alcohol dehydrogenase family n=1 Tax=Geodermatophilus aquaeductus TaxID=1564161 RepID=A0A521DQD2_9ACTN|nr:SDR family oxidoreductase [Geodermatophilus aquaeductus]SMO73927.1 NAD(P)-dependent dehydrogenase, short-chain alcohol dehydrogenase family [Geodermatophilus aquaeductus]